MSRVVRKRETLPSRVESETIEAMPEKSEFIIRCCSRLALSCWLRSMELESGGQIRSRVFKISFFANSLYSCKLMKFVFELSTQQERRSLIDCKSSKYLATGTGPTIGSDAEETKIHVHDGPSLCDVSGPALGLIIVDIVLFAPHLPLLQLALRTIEIDIDHALRVLVELVAFLVVELFLPRNSSKP